MSNKPSQNKRDETRLHNISLAPLTPEQALLAAMNTKPSARKKVAKKNEKKP